MKEYFGIFGGGGIRGVAYVGALRALLEQEIRLTGLAGSSIGAVFATLFAIGYDVDEIEDIFLNIKTELFQDINFNLGKDFALSKGEKFLNWMSDLVESKFYGSSYQKGKMPPVRFRDIENELIILSTNLTDSTFKEFSKHTTPDSVIAHAVRASVSMPGLYKPVYEDGEIIVDGDLIKSHPLWRVSPNLCPPKSRILEFRLEDVQKDKKIDNSLAYLNAVYNTISGFATDFIIDLYSERDKFDYIKINSNNVSVLDFMISRDKRQELIRTGYETTNEYFKYRLPLKQRKLFENYYNIKLILTRLLFELDKSDIKAAYCVLAELFVHLCEHKRFIDLVIYEQIVEFKNLFKRNYKTTKFFFVDGCILNEKKLVVSELRKIIEIVDLKTVELKV